MNYKYGHGTYPLIVLISYEIIPVFGKEKVMQIYLISFSDLALPLRSPCLWRRGGGAIFSNPTKTNLFSTPNHRYVFSLLQVSHIGDYFTSKAIYETEDEANGGEVEGPDLQKKIKKGDKINLHDLLFTKDRDYLVRYQDNQRVKAEHLAAKIISLLASPQRDYVISNKGDKVPIHTLEDKMLWNHNTVFTKKDGSEVPVSQLAGCTRIPQGIVEPMLASGKGSWRSAIVNLVAELKNVSVVSFSLSNQLM
ncbi:hypothetical protein POM88_032978 [Heracleum sosnowskyi]|uniref:Uncharacterized protein n=1 Tax=Heracleum sosnowskyi TaxID=360622 RepID=A0AAD8MI21_9APIA|nr:hypothetical protein POM88_032978 [Heracleum sosnowskyi]